MKKVNEISEWKFTKEISDTERIVDVSIHLKYPETKDLIKFSPVERKNKIKLELKSNFQKLLDTGIFKDYTLIGTKSKPAGITAKIPFSFLHKISKISFVRTVFINKISHAKRIKSDHSTKNYYCVRMTVAIEIEGKKKGLQTFEDRFVLIRANSFDDAYKKIEKQKKKYAEPYLNSNGELVRWKIESLDDCFLTEINSHDDLNNPEGVEVFSVLKERRLTKERTWSGKPSS